jgi:DNA topoisomerase I
MLIIVESPAKAKTISKIVGNKHIVKASVGHIRRISDAKKTKTGESLEINGIDTNHDFEIFYEVDEDKKKVVSELKKLAKSAKDGILFATDEDREGEAISWHLAQILKLDPTKIKRLVFHEITKTAILKAMGSPRDLNLNLVSAQQARQVLDKLVGYKLSPVLWAVMSNYKLSAGRVQSPALKLICEREKEIMDFKPQEIWEILGNFVGQKINEAQEIWSWEKDQKDQKDQKSLNKEELLKATLFKGQKLPKIIENQEIVQKLTQNLSKNPEFKVKSITEKVEFSYTKPPFITSTLQQAASSKLGFSPKQTMSLAQKLYEGINIDGEPTGLITYMRTDSFNLSNDSLLAARKFISQNFSEFLPQKSKFYKSKSRNAQEAHEAIRPTDPLRTPESLKNKIDTQQWKLYNLIWKQMLASQMTDETRQRVSFSVQNAQKDEFSGSIAWTISAGYKALFPELISPKKDFKLQVEEVIFLDKVYYKQSFSKPPARYSPASLIKKMEELGIGRPSTYASIISTLHDRTYVQDENRVLIPTTLGMKVNTLLSENFDLVTSSKLTAVMEENLDKISRGEKEYKQVLADFWWSFKEEVENKQTNLKTNREKYTTAKSDVKCPKYGDLMVLKVGRFGEYYQNPNHLECIYPKNFREYEIALKDAQQKFADQILDKKCQECSKDLIVRVSKASLKPYIACSEYKVGNKHTVMPINFGVCPECQKNKRNGVLVEKSYRGKSFLACNLPKKECGYIQKENIQKEKIT